MGITYWNGNYFMERVCGNYYVTAYKLRETWENNKGKDPKDRKDLSAMANSQDLRKKVLEDDVDEHPLPDGVQMPGHTRKTKISSMGKNLELHKGWILTAFASGHLGSMEICRRYLHSNSYKRLSDGVFFYM